MRLDPAGSLLTQRIREPRVVVGIIYPTGSIYATNKPASQIANVPGNVIDGAIENLSATSQELAPAEGRATIGTLSFALVDVANEVTNELRDQLLNNSRGVGRREVRVYTGDSDDFTDGSWVRTDTYQVTRVEFDRNVYKFSCSDKQRALKERVFVKKSARLLADLSVSETTEMEVSTTDGFEMLAHTAAFSDAPSATVGYLKVRKTGEIIRYTGFATSPTRFTGLTRGRFNTRAQAVDIDPGAEVDRQPEIEEFIYLEMPAPQMMYAIMTGTVLGTANAMPADWHLGIATADVEADMFNDIGVDLFDPSDHTAGLVLNFEGLKEWDGKQFIEEQLHVPMWTFSPITPEGTLGIRRLTRVLAGAPPVIDLTPTDVIDFGGMEYATDEVINRVVISWNWDGDDFTRTTTLINSNSIAIHGFGRSKEYKLYGLTVQRHTLSTLRRIVNAITDRYGAPPIILDCQLSASLNALEIGDVPRLTLPVSDFASSTQLLRSFEVQSRQMAWLSGEFNTKLFASTSTDEEALPAGVVPINDSWYSSEGTALNAVLTMSGNTVTANGNLPAGVYYHLDDFTIADGVTVTVNGTVQLRIRGLPTINGVIDGIGRGQAAVADPNVVNDPVTDFTFGPSLPRYPQTLGITRSGAGVWLSAPQVWASNRSNVYAGAPAVARPALEVIAGNLLNIPTVLEGTPGMPGNSVNELTGPGQITVRALGGAGGASGAGLVIVSRGTPVFGASGEIDLSGADGTAPGSTYDLGGNDVYPGAGAGGSAGGLLILLDGTDLVFPDLSNTFTAVSGDTPSVGNPIRFAGLTRDPDPSPATPWTGYDPGVGNVDMWDPASLIMWVPVDIETGDSDDEETVAPTALTATTDNSGVRWDWELNTDDPSVISELWVATTNDRTGALRVGSGSLLSSIFASSDTAITRYGWVRNFKNGKGYSEWHPVSSTAGVSATYGGNVTDTSAFIFRQPTAPSGPEEGWIWIDTDDLRVYRFNGSTWDQIASDDALLLSANPPAEGGADAALPILSTSILVNGTFERGDKTGWGGPDQQGTIVNAGAGAYRGSYVMEVQCAAGGPNQQSDRIAIQPGERVFASCVAERQNSPDADAALTIRFYNASDSFFAFTTLALADFGTAGWQVLRGVATAPAGAASFAVDLGESDGTTGEWWYDNVTAAFVPRDADIDALLTTNAPAEASADVTGNHPTETLSDELILDRDFELGGADYWSINGKQGSVVRFGASAMSMSNTAINDNYQMRYQGTGSDYLFIPVEPGEILYISGWMRSPAVAGSGTGVRTFDDTLTHVAWQQLIDNTVADTWEFLQNTFTVPAGVYFVVVWMSTANLGSGTSYWDRLSLRKSQPGSDNTADNADTIIFRQSAAPTSPQPGWIWQDTDDSRVYRYNGSTWDQLSADDALLLGLNAPAEGGADVTNDNRSLTDWGAASTFSPNWTGGFSTAPTEDLYYAVSEDGLWGRLWAEDDVHGTSDATSMTINNLPAAVRPAGSSLQYYAAESGTALDNSSNTVLAGARVAQASHGSAGVLEFATVFASGSGGAVTLNNTGWTGSGTKGPNRGLTFTWRLT